MVLSLMFFLTIQIICLNIVFGIIIDSFSETRDEKKERNDDLYNVCFVCGNSRAAFSNHGKSFDQHLEKDHKPWHYIYYIVHLQEKGFDELSGLETNVWNYFTTKKTKWIPIGQTKYLKQEDTETSNLEKKIDALEKKFGDDMKHILHRLSQIQGDIHKVHSKK